MAASLGMEEDLRQLYRWILGLHISGDTLYACAVRIVSERRYRRAFTADLAGFRDFKEWCSLHECSLNTQTLCCVGHTGLNTREIVQFLLAHQVDVWLESPEHIKRKIGSTRDKVDAEIIAGYALLHQSEAVVVNLPGGALEKLKDLQGNRSRLVQAIQNLQDGTQALKDVDVESAQLVERVNRDALRGLEKSLAQVEETIARFIGSLKLSLRKKI